MTNELAKNLVDKAFEQIKKSRTIADLEVICDLVDIPFKNRMDVKRYPKIEFSIHHEDIETLISNKILNDNLDFSSDVTAKITDPLSKILYSIAWKNGDLVKIKHIIKGILDCDEEVTSPTEALVFYQFGKYLTKRNGQPIIDQHVLRAYAVYCAPFTRDIENLRKIEILNKTHKSIINDYKDWLKSDDITLELRDNNDYTYHIDKLLFAIGKTIKLKKNKKLLSS